MTASHPVAESTLWLRLAELQLSDLPRGTQENVAALVLDHMTCAVVGMDLGWTRIVKELARSRDPLTAGAAKTTGRYPAFAYGDDRPLLPANAALINATAAHGLDLDDVFLPAMSHPGAVVIATAIAMGTALGARGAELLASIAAGYEAMGRVGRAVGVRNVDHGFHATGQQGPLGAVTAAGRLLGFDGRRMESAAGVAASMGGGIKAFTAGPGMVKRLHAGRAAEAGLFAADAVAQGFEGPRCPLTSEFGFLRVFALGANVPDGVLLDGLGATWIVDDIYLKPYAACGALHGAIVAAEEARQAIVADRTLFVTEDISEVVVGSSRRATEQNSDPEPDDVMGAQYSMEYSIALALRGEVGDANRFLAVETGDDADVRRLARRVRLEVDPRAQAAYPASNEGRVRVLLADGHQIDRYGVARAASSRGWAVAEDKFRRVAAPTMGTEVVDAVVTGALGLLNDGSLDAVTKPLVGMYQVDHDQ